MNIVKMNNKYYSYVTDPEIPGYKKVDYIQFNGTQQINTGIYPDSTTVVQCKFVMTNFDGSAFIGDSGTSDSNDFRFFRAGSITYLDFGNGYGNRIQGTYVTSTTDIYEVEFGNKYVKDLITGTIKFSGSTTSFSQKSYTIKICKNSDYGKIYYCKIYKGGVLVRDYIPVINSNNILGLYDKVNNTFTTDINGHNFTYGRITEYDKIYYVIKNQVPSRYIKVDYIQSSGTQYIDTGIIANPSNVQYFKITANIHNSITTTTSQVATLFGAEVTEISDWQNYGLHFNTYGTNFSNGEGTIYGRQINAGIVVNTKVTYQLKAHVYSTTEGLATVIGDYINGGTNTKSLVIFATNGNENIIYFSTMELYEFKLGKSEYELAIDLVPVYDTITQKYGMYDFVSKSFFGNNGTGNFTGGND